MMLLPSDDAQADDQHQEPDAGCQADDDNQRRNCFSKQINNRRSKPFV
jgi:hypothetical protein